MRGNSPTNLTTRSQPTDNGETWVSAHVPGLDGPLGRGLVVAGDGQSRPPEPGLPDMQIKPLPFPTTLGCTPLQLEQVVVMGVSGLTCVQPPGRTSPLCLHKKGAGTRTLASCVCWASRGKLPGGIGSQKKKKKKLYLQQPYYGKMHSRASTYLTYILYNMVYRARTQRNTSNSSLQQKSRQSLKCRRDSFIDATAGTSTEQSEVGSSGNCLWIHKIARSLPLPEGCLFEKYSTKVSTDGQASSKYTEYIGTYGQTGVLLGFQTRPQQAVTSIGKRGPLGKERENRVRLLEYPEVCRWNEVLFSVDGGSFCESTLESVASNCLSTNDTWITWRSPSP